VTSISSIHLYTLPKHSCSIHAISVLLRSTHLLRC